MKFTDHLRQSSIPEWKDKYVDYKLGKIKLKTYRDIIKANENVGVQYNQNLNNSDEYDAVKARIVDEFVKDWVIDDQLENCNEFYQWQLDLCRQKFGLLKQQMKIYNLCKQMPYTYGSMYPLTAGTMSCGLYGDKRMGKSFDEDKFSYYFKKYMLKISQLLRELDLIPSLPLRWKQKNSQGPRPHYAHHLETFTVDNLTPRQIKLQLCSALVEFYLTIQLLKSYRDLNVTGLRKIVKKFDKACNTNEVSKFMAHANEHSTMFQHMQQNLNFYAKSLQKANSISQPSSQVNISLEQDPLTYWERKVSEWYTESLTESAQDRKHSIQKLRNLSIQYSLNDQVIHRTNQSIVRMFFAGTGIGISLVFIAYTLTVGIISERESFYHVILFPVWGGLYLILLMGLLFCLNCYIWFRSKINYQFIMFGELNFSKSGIPFNNDFSTTRISSYLYILSVAAITCSSLGLISYTSKNLITWIIWIVVFTFAMVINYNILPSWKSLRKTRHSLVLNIIRLILSGAYPVKFCDFFLGDLACSLSYSMANIGTVYCVFTGNSYSRCGSSYLDYMGFLSALPSYWRFMQCVRRYLDSNDKFPHLLNAGKYASGMLYNGALCTYRISFTQSLKPKKFHRNFFIAVAAVNSIYTSVWDLVMDWSLFQQNPKNLFLRSDLYLAGKRNLETGSYSRRRKWVYYFCMIIDVIIRFEWIFYIIVDTESQQSALNSFILALLEVFRRFIWVIFRAENEHVANVHLFKITKDAPLPFPVLENSPDDKLETEVSEEQLSLSKAEHIGDAVMLINPQKPEKSYRNTSRRALVQNMVSWAHAKDFQRPPVAARNSSDEEHGKSELNILEE